VTGLRRERRRTVHFKKWNISYRRVYTIQCNRTSKRLPILWTRGTRPCGATVTRFLIGTSFLDAKTPTENQTPTPNKHMKFSDKSHNLRIELDTKNFQFSQGELEKMEHTLDPLREPVRNFPVSDLYITVTRHARSNDYHVRTSLVLPGRTLFTGDRDIDPLAAWGRCVRKLISKLTAYKENLAAKPEQSKVREGTAQEIVPEAEPDATQLVHSIEAGDYAEFRRAMYPYEEAVRKRAGRWIERYPEFEERLGLSFTLEDLVEEVFLNAFERFESRPGNVRLGQWLEELIDPSVNALLKDPDTERENIEAVRTARETLSEE